MRRHVASHRSTHFKHFFWLNKMLQIQLFSFVMCCHFTISVAIWFHSILLSFSLRCPRLRHLIISLIMCWLALAASISRLSSLIDRAIIFLLLLFFFHFLSLCVSFLLLLFDSRVFHIDFDLLLSSGIRLSLLYHASIYSFWISLMVSNIRLVDMV